MADLPAPTKVERPTPVAVWRVDTGHVQDEFEVRRDRKMVQISGHHGKLRASAGGVASRLGAAVSAAAVWTDEPVVTCAPGCAPDCAECQVVEPQTIDGDLLKAVVLSACPQWMADEAAQVLADLVLAKLAGVEGVTVTRGPDSTPWTPDTAAGNRAGGTVEGEVRS